MADIITFKGAELNVTVKKLIDISVNTNGDRSIAVLKEAGAGIFYIQSDEGVAYLRKDGANEIRFNVGDLSGIKPAIKAGYSIVEIGFVVTPNGNLRVTSGIGKSFGKDSVKVSIQGIVEFDVDEAINRAFIKNPAPIGGMARTVSGQTTAGKLKQLGE